MPLLGQLLSLVLLAAPPATDGKAPISYTISFPDPASHEARVSAVIPTGGAETAELFMPLWSPGFYHAQNYHEQVLETSAAAKDRALEVDHPKPNRWIIHTAGAPTVTFTYRLQCERAFVTTNWVGPDHAILCGPATFITMLGGQDRPHDVRLVLPQGWPRSICALPAAADDPNHYLAPNYDTLLDSPMAAGVFKLHDFTVEGSRHEIAEIGETGPWEGGRAAGDLEKIVRAHHALWGTLPYDRYVFLLSFHPGGGGLEHASSALMTTSPTAMETQEGYRSWLSFAAHEYFHAFNVKRLRPVELGPFDYENPPRTPSLWISEGLTSYYGDLLLARAGLLTQKQFLDSLSSHIRSLQNAPGRLRQTLSDASLNVWTDSYSGIGTGERSVSYYIKGQVVGFLLDARLRALTDGRRSMDDLMRLAFARYSGARGFTPEEFRAAAGEITGDDAGRKALEAFFPRALDSTDELDYGPALDYFGLRFNNQDGRAAWTLEAREDASEAQKARLRRWVTGASE